MTSVIARSMLGADALPDDAPGNEGLAKYLAGLLLPICIWGLISTLLLHLIHIRSIFIQGGERKLIQATLAFAAGVILVQLLKAEQGRTVARAYAWLLGFAIFGFAAYHAYAFRLPIHPFFSFLINAGLYSILWWAADRITAACSVQSPEAVEAAAESGILRRGRRELDASDMLKVAAELDDLREEREYHSVEDIKPAEGPAETPADKQWAERLTRRHPGRVILYFSLFAIPAFGAGVYLFGDPAARIELGVLLFIYLWCALNILFLSSLRQLDVYFRRRGVSLPNMVGLTWMAIGFLVVTVVMILAFFLPQPPTVANMFVRQRVIAVYRGWESEHGMKDSAASGGQGQGQGAQKGGGKEEGTYGEREAVNELNSRYSETDRLNDPYLSELQRNTGIEPEYRNLKLLIASKNEAFNTLAGYFFKFVIVLAAVCGIFVAYALVFVFIKRLREGISEFRMARLKKAERAKRGRRRGDAEEGAEPGARRFRSFVNPFTGAGGARDGNALVRYLWEAMLAYCGENGSPCPPELTPREFVAARPEALEGFEEHARFIADLFCYSEFSGRPIPEMTFPDLEKFWLALQRHANAPNAR